MSTEQNNIESSNQKLEGKLTIQEQKALEKKQMDSFIAAVKAALSSVLEDNKYRTNKIRTSAPTGAIPDEDTAQWYTPHFVFEVRDYLDLAEEKLPDGFVSTYREKLLKVYRQEWVIPSCIFTRMLDIDNEKNLSLWLDIPHRSEADPVGSLSYYRNMQDVVRERETRTKPGRWFGAKELGTEAEGLLFNSHWTSTGTPLAKHFLLSETKGLSEESWKWAYGNTVSDTGSCMIKVPDAARVYAFDNRLDLFYITDNNEPDGKIIARTILRKDTKKYIRLYSKNHTTEMQAKSSLTVLGYEYLRSLHGIHIGKVKPDNLLDNSELYWLSYLDSENDAYIIDKGSYWLCHDSEHETKEEREARREGNCEYHEGQYSKGYFGFGKCSCGKSGYDLYIAYTVKDDKEGVVSSCLACTSKYLVKETEYSQKYYDKKYFSILRDYTAEEDDCDEDCSYESKVIRKGSESELNLNDDKVSFEYNGYTCIDYRSNLHTDVFGTTATDSVDSLSDLFEYCQKDLREFLTKEFEDAGVKLDRHTYKDQCSLNIWNDSDIWTKLHNCTSYNWENGRHVKEHSVENLLNILEETGKIAKGSYARYLQKTNKVSEGGASGYRTFRSNSTGSCGLVLTDNNDCANASTSLTGYTFLVAA